MAPPVSLPTSVRPWVEDGKEAVDEASQAEEREVHVAAQGESVRAKRAVALDAAELPAEPAEPADWW